MADLHGRPKALRRVLADVAAVGVDEIVCLGDYLEAKVPRRYHDPSRFWPLESVVDPDPALWARLAELRLVLGNQEVRIRELLRPGQVPADLAALLEGPSSVRLDGLLGMHGHQIGWTRADVSGLPHEAYVPVAADVPREPVVVVGHTHQVAMFDIIRADVADSADSGDAPGDEEEAPAGDGAADDGAAAGDVVVCRSVPVRPGHPVAVRLAEPGPPAVAGGATLAGGTPWTTAVDRALGADRSLGVDRTLLINIGPVRGKPSNWLLYDTSSDEVTFRQIAK